MQKITPFLWFETGAKEAADFYVSVFGDSSRITSSSIMQNTPSGTVEIIGISLQGNEMTLMSAGPFQKINSAISFVISCEGQDEVDHFWNSLSAVPEAERCGWLTDKYGVTWQVVPQVLNKLMSDPDKEKAMRVQQAMLKMKKIDIAGLEAAYRGN